MLDQLRERSLFRPKWLLMFTLMVAMLLALVVSFAPGRSASADPVATPSHLFDWGASGTGPGEFNGSIALAIDSSGNVYVSDQSNSRIQKFDSSGVFLLEWGGLPTGSGDGEFNFTFDVAIDASDNLYVVDIFNQGIQKFDTSGNFLLKWGSYGTGDGQFVNPVGVAVDASGDNVYVTDFQNHRIQKFDDTGAFILEWGSNGTGDGLVQFPLWRGGGLLWQRLRDRKWRPKSAEVRCQRHLPPRVGQRRHRRRTVQSHWWNFCGLRRPCLRV